MNGDGGRHAAPADPDGPDGPTAPTGPDETTDPGGAGRAEPDEQDPFAGPAWRDRNDVAAEGDGLVRTRKRRSVNRKKLRTRRRAGTVMLVVGGLIVLGGIWLLVTGLLARGQLDDLRGEVRQLRTQIAAGDLDSARATARQIADHAHRADLYTTGPAWWIAAHVPAGGQPFATVRTVTSQTDVLGSQVLPRVVEATHSLDPSALRRPNGTIDLARISAVAPDLHTADAVMMRATGRVADSPAHTWLGPVDHGRESLLLQMQSLSKALHSADLATRIVPGMLGEHGVKRYFIGFQNDAEARGTGGLPGAFAIVQADHGKLRFERFESDTTLTHTKSGISFGPGYANNWRGSHPLDDYLDSNVSANFPYAAQIWMAMWRRYSGQQLDGALAVDPAALSYLLRVTGPARMPGGQIVSAANVVQLTQQTVYARYPTDNLVPQRKRFLLQVARSVSHKVLQSHASTTALVRAAGLAGVQRRLLIYSANAADERGLQQTSLSGAVPVTSQPYSQLTVNNAAGNKLDYYLDRRMTYRRSGCGSTRDVTVTFTMTNTTPADVPAYAARRNDHPTYRTRRGDNLDAIYYYATKGAIMTSLRVDGQRRTYYAGSERGHPLFGLEIEIPRGQSRTLVMHFREPAGKGNPIVVRQPLVRPLKLTIDNQTCG